jgi:isopentenyldiphosphate isomerase
MTPSKNIVTSFLTNDSGKFLLLKRSPQVKTMKCLWSGTSGVIECDDPSPLYRAKKEILEELQIKDKDLTLLKQGKQIIIHLPHNTKHPPTLTHHNTWIITPFLFKVYNTPPITLNWENSEFCWITKHDISKYPTVPHLDMVLSSLL